MQRTSTSSNLAPVLVSSLCDQLEMEAKGDGVAKQVAAAVVARDGGVLILRRVMSDPFLPGYWELPSGGRERQDKTLVESLGRELREETGLSLVAMRDYLGCFDYITNSGRKARQWNFLVQTDGAPIVLCPAEHDLHKWAYSADDLPLEMQISPESRAAVLAAFKVLPTA